MSKLLGVEAACTLAGERWRVALLKLLPFLTVQLLTLKLSYDYQADGFLCQCKVHRRKAAVLQHCVKGTACLRSCDIIMSIIISAASSILMEGIQMEKSAWQES